MGSTSVIVMSVSVIVMMGVRSLVRLVTGWAGPVWLPGRPACSGARSGRLDGRLVALPGQLQEEGAEPFGLVQAQG
jgi:hypothetical protein